MRGGGKGKEVTYLGLDGQGLATAGDGPERDKRRRRCFEDWRGRSSGREARCSSHREQRRRTRRKRERKRDGRPARAGSRPILTDKEKRDNVTVLFANRHLTK